MSPDLPEPPWRTPAKEATHRTLSRETIVRAAMNVLRSEGIEGISMRRVAAVLGTGPASLYAHVANKEELLELLFDEVVAEVPIPVPDPARWREQVTALWSDSRNALLRYRDIGQVALGSFPAGPNSLRVSEAAMALLRAGGVPDQAVAWAVDIVGLYIAASAIEGTPDRKHEPEEGRDPVAPRQEQLRKYLASLPADRFPNLAALLPFLTTGGEEERFRFGLDLLVRGLAALAAEAEGRAH